MSQIGHTKSSFRLRQICLRLVCGGGQVVSLLAFYSDNPSLNPAEVFFVKFVFEIKEPGAGP